MTQESEIYLLQEAIPPSTLTPEQIDRLDKLDWYIDIELPRVMQENKEYGVLQAQWRHSDRMNILLFQGIKT